MRLLYFDPFNGVSGDMILGALLDLGLPLEHLRSQLGKLELHGFDLACQTIERGGLRGVRLQVEGTGQDQNHGPQRGHHDPRREHGRGFEEIREMIESSSLDSRVRSQAVAVFRRLGEAEARVHGCPLSEVHFHEVGAIDALVDIVGACIGFQYFEIERFYTAPLHLGKGTVTFSHGTWPVPAPATAQLIQGFPVLMGPVEGELTTPTGAAIVTTLVEPDQALPLCRFEKTGWGAGEKAFPGIPNMLRLMLGQTVKSAQLSAPSEVAGVRQEQVLLLEASIDDLEPETFGHFLERALGKGALDVYYVPLHMKKNRPGLLLCLLCRPEDAEKMAELIFQETTTFGIRWSPWQRWILDREVKTVETEYGPVRVKIGRLRGRLIQISPEYEDLKAISEKHNIPLRLVRQRVLEKTIPWNRGLPETRKRKLKT